MDLLERLGLEPRVEEGFILFCIPEYPRLDDAESVGQGLAGPQRMLITLRIDGNGEFQIEA